MDESILLESGERVIVAVPQGEPCVFNKPRLEFIRPKWTDDADAKQCLYCQSKFTQLRRKHHCRACGRLFCSKCCNDKTVLTHLGINDFERTCIICKPILILMTKAFSQDMKLKEEAAAGFQDLIQHVNHMQELLESGGLHTLIWLCGVSSPRIYKPVVSALHTLATQASLQKYLLNAGIVQALSSVMKNVNSSEQIFTDCISTLLILNSTEQAVRMAVMNGGLTSILGSISKVDELTRLLSLQVVSRMCIIDECHSAIMDNYSTVTYFSSLAASSQDLQISTLVFTILGEISAGERLSHKVILAQAESNTTYISQSLVRVKSSELLSIISCLLANLASVSETQTYLSGTLCKLKSHVEDPSKPYYVHVVRALANFSRFPQNSYSLMEYIPLVVKEIAKLSDKDCLNFSLCLVTNLLEQSAEEASEHICRSDCKMFLTRLMQTSRVASTVSAILSSSVAATARPPLKQ
ncbi:uncharacterized protein [Watersipora subatra]|uniref:uncharacterized protein n=1 Tax=Watersipora subatra TaxID=2589382 RepID=UPI00355B7850